jgi:hypothetical protein
MYSGLALLMDIHHPDKSNGRGVLFVAGSAWQARLTYGAVALKEEQISDWSPALLRAGYTVFAINHRAARRFHYPVPVDDLTKMIGSSTIGTAAVGSFLDRLLTPSPEDQKIYRAASPICPCVSIFSPCAATARRRG